MKKLLTYAFGASLLLKALVAPITANAQSKMPEALEKSQLSPTCQAKLVRIADDIIGIKTHRILGHHVSDSDTFAAFILLSYKDQDSHLNLSAIPTDKGCEVNMRESYELTATCLEARQSIFKRWEMLGRLDEKTIVVRYDHPRKKAELLTDENARAMGFLTPTRHGEACLITKQQNNIPLPPEKEERE